MLILGIGHGVAWERGRHAHSVAGAGGYLELIRMTMVRSSEIYRAVRAERYPGIASAETTARPSAGAPDAKSCPPTACSANAVP